MPRTTKGGPELTTSQGHPNAHQSAITATRISPIKGGRQHAGRRKAAVTCRVSLLVPSGRRTWWWILGRCPVCGTPFLGRARHLQDVTRERRGQCGHRLTVVIARTYDRRDSGAAA
jgi:hypothetical protein